MLIRTRHTQKVAEPYTPPPENKVEEVHPEPEHVEPPAIKHEDPPIEEELPDLNVNAIDSIRGAIGGANLERVKSKLDERIGQLKECKLTDDEYAAMRATLPGAPTRPMFDDNGRNYGGKLKITEEMVMNATGCDLYADKNKVEEVKPVSK